MSSPVSSSDGEARSTASFDVLHEKVKRWIWDQRWTELRDLQEAAIPPILAGKEDVILAAATASGKTEAAFFPICSHLVDASDGGVHALYVGPLKALINDQFRRLDDPCKELAIPVHRWHGDVSSGKKQKLIRNPAGILLITPESLEALFVVHGPSISRVLGPLSYVVIDELHSFLGSERGRQLQSLLHRVELALKRRVPRVALSATLGDMALAAEFLRPGQGSNVRVIVSKHEGNELKLQVRGYWRKAGQAEDGSAAEDTHAMANHLFQVLRGTDNLIFANRRRDVELLADLLSRRSEQEHVPCEFFAHHGSLSRELREDVEARLKKEIPGPVSVVCTSTLEMGIDIASVKSVAQIGAPFSVASLRQRLGRSGRRAGEPAVLRVYIQEEEITEATAPSEQLRSELVQTVAVITLLLERWCEPPVHGALHLSTLVQQVLSLIAQHGGVSAAGAYRALCEQGPFSGISRTMFAALLRGLAQKELISQTGDGTLVIGKVGERLVSHYSFFAAFQTPEEYRVVTAGKLLGTLPTSDPLLEDTYLLFAGRRWRIVHVDAAHRVVDVEPAAGTRVPRFGGAGGLVHDRVRERMREGYVSFHVPSFLDARAQELLLEGRANFDRLGLRQRSLVEWGQDTMFFPWAGDRVMNTIAVQMVARGLEVEKWGIALVISSLRPGAVAEHLDALARQGSGDAASLAKAVGNKIVEKYDDCLPENLLCAGYASGMLDSEGALRTIERELQREGRHRA